MRDPSFDWIFTGNEALCAARRRQQAAQPHSARFLGEFLVAQIVATFHGRARAAIYSVAVVVSICGGIWSLCARKARKRERNLRTNDQKLQARNGTKLVPTCGG